MTTEIRRPISLAARDPRWSQEAECQYTDPELFFPVGHSKAAVEQAERAKAVCMQCPVRDACLEWAVATGEQFGVLGGLTQEERWALTKVTPRGPGQAMDRCLEAREQILAWREELVPLRRIASLLNVDRSVLRAALQRFSRDDKRQHDLEVAA
ncbi:WhiB family transcriptional regulator [Streptomyces gardneri]|uniref:WhiB family transcriptional regulator n=1 Tax=Streptomyces gardneri TaxID=66892 RepID=UPI003678142D